MRHKLIRWLGLLGIALLVIGGASLILSLLALRGFSVLPQDCNGTSIRLSGTVNVGGALVTVKGENDLYKGTGALDLTLTADANGKFDSGETYLPVFVCEALSITVSAKDYVTKQINYVLLDHFSDDALTASMRDHRPVPVVLDFELERHA